MTNRNRNRDQGNDWDWYYYEYRYTPYSPYRRNDYYGSGLEDRDYYDNNMYYGRNYDYNRNEFGTENGGHDFDYRSNQSGNANYGRYSGYGPRDYRRSDERIMEDVNDRLTWHSMIDATDINVAVNNGVVTLTGSVDRRQDKRLAEDIVDDVPGVWDVDNRLNVRNKGYFRSWRDQGNRADFRPGMEVVDRDGNRVGEVKEIRDGDFLVDRPMARDIYIPFADCHVENAQVWLKVRSDDIENQGWMMPEPVESRRSQKNR